MKRWLKYLLAAITALAILGVAYEVKGQGCPDDYACALYYRSDIWPRSDLRAHFVFDPGVQGDSLNGEGSFESFSGPEGGCTDCATGWTCSCASGDVDQETTIIYDLDRSIAIDPGAAFAPTVHQTMDFEANKCYQISWRHYGEAGTEDFAVVATNAALTDVYDWATDSWGGGPTTTFANVPASWTCQRFYLRNGVVAKPNYLIALTVTSADGTNVFVDQFRVQELNSCDITGSRGNVLTNDDGGDPLWGHSEVLLPRVGTGPAGKSGMKTDGVDDYLLCADADCEMDPINWAGGGKFSVGCRVVTDTVAVGFSTIMNKGGAAGNRSWYINRGTANINFSITDDGTNVDNHGIVNAFIADVLHSFVSTFDPSGGPGACENNIYYNAYQVDTDAAMTECAPFDSTAIFTVGATSFGLSTWSGSMLECALWEKKLSAVEANKYISPHFPATNHGDGFWVDTCAQAASHSTCSTQICRQGTPNECQAEGTGVQACFDQTEELLENNSWQQITSGGDDNPDLTAWTETETPGDGTASITVYRADGIHGHAARLKTTGTTSATRLRSECMAVAPSTAYTAYLKAKKLTDEVVDFAITYYLYSDGACASQTAWGYVVTSTDLTEGWEEYLGTFTTAADTNSIKIQFPYYRSTADYLVDVASVKVGSYRKPWVHNPVGTTTYTARDYRLYNPLSDFIEAEQKYGYEDGFCAAMWTWTPWAGDDGVEHNILCAPATAGANNLIQILKTVTNNVSFRLYDGVGSLRNVFLASNDTNWTSGDWKYLEVCSNNSDNVISGHFYNFANSTWYDLGGLSGAGIGIQDGQTDELHIGHFSNTNYLDGYIPKIHLSPYPAGNFVWPQKGFNNGRPPVNGRPY